MYNIVLINDFPDNIGGAEIVDGNLAKHLGCSFVAVKDIVDIDKDTFYIVSNISTMSPDIITKLSQHNNYIILEHDYKFVNHRHPWRYPDSIVPKDHLINLDLYRNAKAIFLQTDDHLNVFKLNGIEGNLISLKCSLWFDSEFQVFNTLRKNNTVKNSKFCVIDSDNWIKNTEGAVKFLTESKISFEKIKGSSNYEEFLNRLNQYSCLTFFPIARESCCRLIVEAKCLGLNVLTNNNSGAWRSDWYNLNGVELQQYLENQSAENLSLIKSYL